LNSAQQKQQRNFRAKGNKKGKYFSNSSGAYQS